MFVKHWYDSCFLGVNYDLFIPAFAGKVCVKSSWLPGRTTAVPPGKADFHLCNRICCRLLPEVSLYRKTLSKQLHSRRCSPVHIPHLLHIHCRSNPVQTDL